MSAFKDRSVDYLFNNLLSVLWSVFLLIGGGVFVFYYASIGYLPDLDVKSSILMLGAASVTAIVIVLLLSFIFIFPGFAWSYFIGDSVFFGGCVKRYLTVGGKLRWYACWFGVPLVYALFGFLMYINIPSSGNCLSYVSLAMFVFYLVFVYRRLKRAKLNCMSGKVGFWIVRVDKAFVASFWVSVLSFLFSFLVLFPLSAIYSIFPIKASGWISYFLLIVALWHFVFLNIAAAAKPDRIKGIRSAAYFSFIGVLSIFVIFIPFGVIHKIPDRVMEIFQFGAVDAEYIVFNKDACDALHYYGVDWKIGNNMQCVVPDVRILSRLGHEMYLEKNNISGAGDGVRFSINKSHVLSWAVKTGKGNDMLSDGVKVKENSVANNNG